MPQPLYHWKKRPCYTLNKCLVGPTIGLGSLGKIYNSFTLLGIQPTILKDIHPTARSLNHIIMAPRKPKCNGLLGLLSY